MNFKSSKLSRRLCFGFSIISMNVLANEPSFNCSWVVEDYSTQAVSEFPKGYTSLDVMKLKNLQAGNEYYTVQKEDSFNYLKAKTDGGTITIFKDIKDWDLSTHPVLTWKWRAHRLPTKANEKNSRTNDVGASVYVVWKSNLLMRVKSIKFTWSSSLDIGTHLSKRFGLDNVHVLKNHESKLGEWHQEQVNVSELYKKYYNKKDLVPPIALAILSDGDATKSKVEADYTDFRLCSLESK